MELPICSPIQTNLWAADFSGNETWQLTFIKHPGFLSGDPETVHSHIPGSPASFRGAMCLFKWPSLYGHGSKSRAPSEHPNKID